MLQCKWLGLKSWLPLLAMWLASGPVTRASENQLTFQIASGWQVEQVATEPLVKWPMVVDWDDQGRLVVVESGGVAKPIEQHNEQLLHRIVRLVDEDGDGRMDRRLLAADQLPFAEGVLCLGNDLLVAAPPYIWRLIDEDGDGYCERREIWFDGQTITGCANDLHGPYLGRDGWIYWCKGAFAQQTHLLTDGTTLSDRAAHIFRRHRDGGPIEPVMSGGMDNPVELAVLPNGERFFSSTFLVHPGDGLRDGVVHAIYGGAYGKDHSALEGVVRTGPLMPVMAHLGVAAPSGLICLQSPERFEASQSTLVAALFNLQKVVALPLQPAGATYQTQPVDLLVGSRIDFHPTDVIEDADGSLLVVDTGGWYDLCCPSSRIDQQTAAGGIYRLRPTDQLPRERLDRSSPQWSDLTLAQTADLLEDVRPWVARGALLTLASSGDAPIGLLAQRVRDPQSAQSRRQQSLWALGAIGSPAALRTIAELLSEFELGQSDSALPRIACHLISLYRYRPAQSLVEQVMVRAGDPTAPLPQLARVAAEALGRLGDAQSIRLLMQEFSRSQPDRSLDHSLRYALYGIADSAAVAQYLDASHPAQRDVALSTLALLGAEEYLTATRLVAMAGNTTPAAAAAANLLLLRPNLAESAVELLSPAWQRQLASGPPPELFQRLVGGWFDQPVMQRWMADHLRAPEQPSDWLWVEAALRAAAGKTIPTAWHGWILAALAEDGPRISRLLEKIDLSAAQQAPLLQRLQELIGTQADPATRRQLLVSLPPRYGYRDDQLVEELIDGLASGDRQSLTWECLSRLQLTRASAERLLEQQQRYWPADLMRVIELVASLGDDPLDLRLLQQLADLQSARALPVEALLNLYRGRSDDVRAAARQLVDQLSAADPQVEATVQSVLAELPPGDAIRGLTLFHGLKANCGACHQMGYRGGKIGPELTRIGRSRTREALMEAILFPSQRIEQGYQSMQVLTFDGQVFNGLVIGGWPADKLELRITAERVETLTADQIEQIQPSDVSIMPGGMLELLSRQELADLLSLLEAAQ